MDLQSNILVRHFSSYKSNFIFKSVLEFPTDKISIIKFGEPKQPLSSSFNKSQTTHKSGCTTVKI